MTLTVAEATTILRRYEVPANPDLFFVGQADKRITFYSQQVRALELVHSLHIAGRLAETDRIAVVGAGAAGLTAEMALNVLRIRVELFDTSNQLLSLQAGSPRLLDPKIYEWPRPGSLDLTADLPILTWSRGTAGATRAALVQENLQLEALVATNRPLSRRLNTQVTAANLTGAVWELEFAGDAPAQAFTKVIITSGFGVEPSVGTAPAQSYWSANGPPQPAVANARCLISGIGDGGLTDMLGLLVANFEHRQFTQRFLNLVPHAELAKAVVDADDAAGGAVSLQTEYDARVRPILEKWGVIGALAQTLVAGRSIVMNADGNSILAKGVASKLNQVMAYSVQLAAMTQTPPRIAIAGGRLNDVTDVPGNRKLVHGPTLPDGTNAGEFDLVVVRHGPLKVNHLAWLGGKYQQFVAHRTDLGVDDPASVEPPTLKNDTYSFFHEQQDFFYHLAGQQERASVRERRERLIILQKDQATHSVVERGAVRLLDAIRGNQTGLEVYLSDPPEAFGEVAKVLQPALASACTRVSATSSQQHHAAWQALVPTIAIRVIQLPVQYAALSVPDVTTLSQAVDEVLLSKLNAALVQVWQTGQCEIGVLHPTISAAIQPVWGVWLDVLTNDAELRAHVLQTLWKGEPGTSWDGNSGCLSQLTAALVLMLASSLGVGGLDPSMTGKQSNLSYPTGLAIGSGCTTRRGILVDDCNNPDDWDADIIMLSKAVQLDFAMSGSMAGTGVSLAAASRVAPALVTSSRRWRNLLASPLDDWQAEVANELQDFRERQAAGLAAL